MIVTRIWPFIVWVSLAAAQSQTVDCASLSDPAATNAADRRTTAVAAQIQTRRAQPKPSAESCRCGTVDAATLTAKSTSQEVPILSAIPGTYRFDHVLLRETVQFVSEIS